jgi:hypothetical protein
VSVAQSQQVGQSSSLARKLSLAGEIVETYARVRVSLWRRGVPDTVAELRRSTPDLAVPLERWERLRLGRRLGKIVGRTLRLLPADSRCLVRSLVLTRMLVRRGMDARVVIGVSVAPKFQAHAWVESEGVPLLSTGEIEYGRLTEL